MNETNQNIKALSGMLPEELFSYLKLDKLFRAKQIFKWIASGARHFDDMTNISLNERNHLQHTATLFSSSVAKELHDPDGTVKLQIQLYDGSAVETVLLIDRDGRKTACVSCQVGCPINCSFCQTGAIGYKRNLAASEIVEQFFYLEDSVGHLDNIVFMGMGEPMLNLASIRKAIDILTHPQGRNLSMRRITISTAGLIEGIISLADDGPHIRLAVSLTTANEKLRTELMPITKTNSLPELKKAILYFSEKTGKRITLEAALLSQTNTSEECAKEIADFTEGIRAHVNLIAWNPVESLPYKTPSQSEIQTFLKYLEKYKINVTLRTKRGQKIGGACGQLGKVHSIIDSNEIP